MKRELGTFHTHILAVSFKADNKVCCFCGCFSCNMVSPQLCRPQAIFIYLFLWDSMIIAVILLSLIGVQVRPTL